jgi:Tfp pilus assembly protein PilP
VIIVNLMRAYAWFIQCLARQVCDWRRLSPRGSIGLLLLGAAISILSSNPVIAQDAKQQARVITGQANKAVESPIQYSGTSYKSSNRRDPFLNPLLTKKGSKPDDQEETRGLPPPGIAGTFIAQAALQGIVIRDDGRVAVVRGADTRAYFLREGDKLFDGYVKVIESDSITLVRETKMRSGKILSQDVTKRLRTP